MITRFAHTAASIILDNGGTLGLAPGTNQVVTEIKGWQGSAGVRRNSTDRLWAHGTFAERGWKGERVITLSGHIECQTRTEAADLCDSLAAILGDGTQGTFQVDDVDQGSRWAPVQLHGAVIVDWDGDVEIDVTVDMVSNDPRKFGPLMEYQTNTADPGGGLDNDPALLQDGVLDFGDGGTSGTVTVINTGKAPATVLFDVNGYLPATGFIITEVGTGRRLRYENDQLMGDHLVLDGSDGTVMLNGVSDRSVYLTERGWPVLNPGANTYLFEAYGGFAILTVKAASAWW